MCAAIQRCIQATSVTFQLSAGAQGGQVQDEAREEGRRAAVAQHSACCWCHRAERQGQLAASSRTQYPLPLNRPDVHARVCRQRRGRGQGSNGAACQAKSASQQSGGAATLSPSHPLPPSLQSMDLTAWFLVKSCPVAAAQPAQPTARSCWQGGATPWQQNTCQGWAAPRAPAPPTTTGLRVVAGVGSVLAPEAAGRGAMGSSGVDCWPASRAGHHQPRHSRLTPPPQQSRGGWDRALRQPETQ